MPNWRYSWSCTCVVVTSAVLVDFFNLEEVKQLVCCMSGLASSSVISAYVAL
jgi:hypothetical protein